MLSRNQWLAVVLIGLLVVSQLPGPMVHSVSSRPAHLLSTLLTPLSQWMLSAGNRATRRPDLLQRREPGEDAVRQLRAAREEIRRLQRRIEEYERIRHRFGEQLEAFDYVHAAVTRWSGDPANPWLEINRGRRHGVAEGDVVVNYRDLVGRVVDVGPGTATVRLITHPQSRLEVRVQPDTADEPARHHLVMVDAVPRRGRFEAMVEVDADAPIEQGDIAFLHVGEHRAGRGWPEHAYGFDVGMVTRIEPDQERLPLLRKRIVIEPFRDLPRLSNVTVFVRREYERPDDN